MSDKAKVSLSRNFEAALHRAMESASRHRHEYATLEHFLFGLLDDPDATQVMRACNVDVHTLRQMLNDYIDNELSTLVVTDGEDAKPSTPFQRVVQRAVLHVQSSGRETVTGANALVALFTERESSAVNFLQALGMTRLDAVAYMSHGIAKRPQTEPEKLERLATSASEKAPVFEARRGRIRYLPQKATRPISQRKRVALDRCKDLVAACEGLGNEQPHLKSLVARYYNELSALTAKSGIYPVLIAGLDIEEFPRTKQRIPAHPDRNPPLDADLLMKIESLVVANAGLISLFPEARQVSEEIDNYLHESETVVKLRDRVMDAALQHLASATTLLDAQALQITQAVNELECNTPNASQSNRALAVKHSWLRGSLAAIGNFVVRQLKKVPDSTRDAIVNETIAARFRDPAFLSAAALAFLASAKAAIGALATALPTSFG